MTDSTAPQEDTTTADPGTTPSGGQGRAVPRALSTPLAHLLFDAPAASAISGKALAVPAAAVLAPPVITGIKEGVAAVISWLKQRVITPIAEFVQGTLLLVRRWFDHPKPVSPSIGVDFSLGLASDPPTYTDAVKALRAQGITSIRMYTIDLQALAAIKQLIPNANVTVEVSNQVVAHMAADPTYANSVLETLQPYKSIVKTIVIGNEVDAVPPEEFGGLPTVTQAVINMQNAVAAYDLPYTVTCSFTYSIIANSYPPSASILNPNMPGLTELLKQLKGYAELDIYPMLVLAAQPQDVPLDYALGQAANPVVDPVNGVSYNSLFWAQYDGAKWAFQKAGINIPIYVGETGWATDATPSADYATVKNAQTYNQNLINTLLTTGSPAFHVKDFPTYLFEFSDEDLKPGGSTEKYFGWYAIDNGKLVQKYPLNLRPKTKVGV
ncbi:glycosyl hydrolase family 17 protein [Mycobacterium sp. RTGN5]|uniref:glycosyl hydrolase family 17 protein n=1 Tax=Mycobacterium sp. RTGN5 TaxID=3016522 RepID=UPI0029C873B6|nr:glycosyl hydrolase family 17 protein [Mycobacterium sp. RTGN5]